MKNIYNIFIFLLISVSVFAGFNSGVPSPLTLSGSPAITSSTPVNIKAYYSATVTDTVAAGAATVNWNDGNNHYMVLGNGAHTITLSNPVDGIRCTIIFKQPASGASATITFSPVPYYPGGTIPSLTATNGSIDLACLIYNSTLGKYILTYGTDCK